MAKETHRSPWIQMWWAPRTPFTPCCGALNLFLCRIVFVLLAGDAISKVIKKNEYNMFGEYITVIKIPN